MARLVLLLPCYNEQTALPPLLDRVAAVAAELAPDWRLSVLVVDDGSTDETADAATVAGTNLALTVCTHPANRGLGAALATGITWYLEQPPVEEAQDVLAVMDADGTHPPELLPEMLRALTDESRAVVIASRYAAGGAEFGLSPLRRLYSRLASLVLRAIARLPGVRDYTCGYRLYRRRTLAQARERFGARLITETSFVCMAELLIKLARTGARCAEVPLQLHYELKGGPSKMNVAATIWRYVALAWRVLFRMQYN
jgi:dolichol-phosphate mannosyltransferase